uniref:Uncharacterized protein n=1 Tax=CrAss-like virus sp. ctt4r3 TaxID=2823619 RepID=A0A8S5L7J5_9CAUD|nr:MAG TPA: hypothetical protein [CrAss-like virus sp. ctt4r3]
MFKIYIIITTSTNINCIFIICKQILINVNLKQ